MKQKKIILMIITVILLITIPFTAFATTQADNKETTTITHCTDNDNHSIACGNMGRWFSSRNELILYYQSIADDWNKKIENGLITWEEYYKNVPSGYECWSCAYCGKWTGNFKYRDEPTTSEHCTDNNNHSMKIGTIGKWFESKEDLKEYVNQQKKVWLDKYLNGQISWEEYLENVPQGYKCWSCSYCGLWSGDYEYYEETTTEPSTDPTEPTKPTEPSTKPTEPSTKPTEPSTKPTEPSTKPTEPSTKPTEPSTKPTEPSTKPTEPSTKPTEPSTKPTEPSTKPTEPSTDPTEPTKPTEPSTKPTEPSTKPTEPSTDTTNPIVKPDEEITTDNKTSSTTTIAEQEKDTNNRDNASIPATGNDTTNNVKSIVLMGVLLVVFVVIFILVSKKMKNSNKNK